MSEPALTFDAEPLFGPPLTSRRPTSAAPTRPLLVVADDTLLRATDDGLASDGFGLTTAAATNEEMLARIFDLYCRPGMAIADPTWGNGVFYKKVDLSRYAFHGTDLTQDDIDMRDLPYPDASLDVIVLDPPYRYVEDKSHRKETIERCYNTESVRGSGGHDGVMGLYRDGMREAARVLKVGGYLIVKCQDTITDGKQQWVHVDLLAHGGEIGAPCIDMAVVTPSAVPPTRWKVQRSLRKGHSYFLIYRKGGRWPFGYRSVSKR